jgi:hypothetical protein
MGQGDLCRNFSRRSFRHLKKEKYETIDHLTATESEVRGRTWVKGGRDEWRNWTVWVSGSPVGLK